MITVSIIEDDAPARKILAGWIARAKGFRCVSEHPSAEAALSELPKEKPDIVLADINLPGMSGIECVRQLKMTLPETQFVMLTVYEDTDHIFDALAAGASGYLLKRTSRAALLAALADVHAGGSPMSSHVARKVVQLFQRPRVGAEETDKLTQREREVLDLAARGYAFKEVSEALGISVTTVGTHIRRIYEKLHVHSRAQAVAAYTKAVRGDEVWRTQPPFCWKSTEKPMLTMTMTMPTPPLISSGKAARLLSVHTSTVNRLIRAGRLRVHQRTPGGHARLSYTEVLALRDSLLTVSEPAGKRRQ